MRRVGEQGFDFRHAGVFRFIHGERARFISPLALFLHADIVVALRELPGLEFRGYRIWHDQGQNLYPFGYPFAFVANQVHQFILIFRYLPGPA